MSASCSTSARASRRGFMIMQATCTYACAYVYVYVSDISRLAPAIQINLYNAYAWPWSASASSHLRACRRRHSLPEWTDLSDRYRILIYIYLITQIHDQIQNRQ